MGRGHASMQTEIYTRVNGERPTIRARAHVVGKRGSVRGNIPRGQKEWRGEVLLSRHTEDVRRGMDRGYREMRGVFGSTRRVRGLSWSRKEADVARVRAQESG